MSARRKAGDQVWVVAGAGFCGQGNRLIATVLPNTPDDDAPCPLCDDPQCREWHTLQNASGYLYHVSECEMFDTPQPDLEMFTDPTGGGR